MNGKSTNITYSFLRYRIPIYERSEPSARSLAFIVCFTDVVFERIHTNTCANRYIIYSKASYFSIVCIIENNKENLQRRRWEKHLAAVNFVLSAWACGGRRSLICLERIPLALQSNREAHHKYLDLYVMCAPQTTLGEVLKIKRTTRKEKNKK